MKKRDSVLEKYVKRGRRTISRIWGKTAVVLIMPWKESDSKKRVFELTPAGTFIWKLLENECKLKDIVSFYAKNKKMKRFLAEKQVLTLINKLAAKKIVDISDALSKG